MKQQFYGWKLLVVLWVVLVIVLGFASYGGIIMNTYMVTDLSLDRKSLGLVQGSFALCMGLISPFVGVCVNRWGTRASFSAGTFMAVLGALAMATIVDGLLGAVIVYGLVMGIAVALGGMIPAQTVVSYWFKRRLGLAMTIVLTGSTMGGFIAAPLLAKLVAAPDGNWRMGWFAVAALCAVAFCLGILFVRNKPSDIGQVQDGAVEIDSSSETNTGSRPVPTVYRTTKDWAYREAVWHPTFWLMIFGAISIMSAYAPMASHGVAHFRDLGHSPQMAAMFLSILIFSGLAGNLVFAILGDRVEPRFLWGASQILAAIGMALAVRATSTIELYASALLLGGGFWIVSLSLVTMAVNYFGKSSYAPIMGLARLFFTLSGAIATVLAGIVFDHFGSYALAFYLAAAVCLLGGVVMLFVVPPVRMSTKLEPA